MDEVLGVRAAGGCRLDGVGEAFACGVRGLSGMPSSLSSIALR
ncbi:hypothetical protein SMD44_08604 [Streptomyces alboflavus]|uniref:Uncharacterized protein n=1 Tax=Streptomyces alboflavus TaxID=67267 RepID=A0A1Z1WRU4_9ACTN|nr:hypothetical protein SMD44_08604 [Streptomyces alboflavus]